MTSHRFFRPVLLPLMLLGLMSGCNYLPDWLGKQDTTPAISGERIALQQKNSSIVRSDTTTDSAIIRLPEAQVKQNWLQALGSSANVSDHIQLSPSLKSGTRITVGEGGAFKTHLIPAPIVANNTVFAMDGNGVISAHQADSLALIWRSEQLVPEDDSTPFAGGGLGIDQNRLIAIGQHGHVVALNPATGKMLWQERLNLITRSPPRLAEGLILVATADNQLIALSGKDGGQVWSHQGVSERAVRLQSIYPAIGGNQVVIAYSSGEIAMLALDSGSVLWSDELADPVSGSGLFTSGFGASISLMTPHVSFAGTSDGFAAFLTRNGRRIWDRPLYLKQMPWLAGTILYALSTDHQLMAINGTNGKILWVQEVAAMTVHGDDALTHWQHPFVASNHVWLLNNRGVAYSFDAQTGNPSWQLEIPENVEAAPVIANGKLYLLTKDAELYSLAP